MGFSPENWRRELAKAGAHDAMHSTIASNRRHLHKAVSHLSRGDHASAEEAIRSSLACHDELEEKLRGEENNEDTGTTGRVDTSSTSDKSVGRRLDARTDISKLDPRDPQAFRKALTAVRANPGIIGR
jgi:hypothetical protein